MPTVNNIQKLGTSLKFTENTQGTPEGRPRMVKMCLAMPYHSPRWQLAPNLFCSCKTNLYVEYWFSFDFLVSPDNPTLHHRLYPPTIVTYHTEELTCFYIFESVLFSHIIGFCSAKSGLAVSGPNQYPYLTTALYIRQGILQPSRVSKHPLFKHQLILKTIELVDIPRLNFSQLQIQVKVCMATLH